MLYDAVVEVVWCSPPVMSACVQQVVMLLLRCIRWCDTGVWADRIG
jgi:hypothetical protein